MSKHGMRSAGFQGASSKGFFYDGVADLYDETRTQYPAELIEQILAFAQLEAGARILEIGCGTGQATSAFATRDLEIVALEPGPNLARHARARFARHPNVSVICDRFEHWTIEAGAFDLVFSAQAFHWVKRKVRFIKAAGALRPGGVLAIFNHIASPGTTPVHEALVRALGETAAFLASRRQWPQEREFTESPYFENLTRHSYPWTQEDSAESYVRRFSTSNRYRRLGNPATLLSTIRDTIEAYGGRISTPYVSQLMMARRNARSLGWRGFIRGWR